MFVQIAFNLPIQNMHVCALWRASSSSNFFISVTASLRTATSRFALFSSLTPSIIWAEVNNLLALGPPRPQPHSLQLSARQCEPCVAFIKLQAKFAGSIRELEEKIALQTQTIDRVIGTRAHKTEESLIMTSS